MNDYFCMDEPNRTGEFSLKLEFDEVLDVQTLSDAAEGLNTILKATSEVCAPLFREAEAGVKIKLRRVEAGSCDFQGISLVVQRGGEISLSLQNVDTLQVFIVCMTGLACITIKEFFDSRNQSLRYYDSTREDISLMIRNTLEWKTHNMEESIQEASKLIANYLYSRGKALLRTFARGLIKLVHPGDSRVKKISAVHRVPNKEEGGFVLLPFLLVRLIPSSLPEDDVKRVSPLYLENIEVEIREMEKEEENEIFLKGRIINNGDVYPTRPLICVDKKLQGSLLKQITGCIKADVTVLRKIDLLGNPVVDQYIIAKLHDKSSASDCPDTGGKGAPVGEEDRSV